MTASMPTLKAQLRAAAGKGSARRLRRAGLVPAVAYGKGLPSTPIAVAPRQVAAILKSELGKNAVIRLELDDKNLLAMIRDYSLSPVERQIEHVDFIEVKLDKPVDVDVPLVPVGKAAGVTAGGVLRVVYRTVPVRCLPDRIPVKIETEVSHLALGQHITTQELKLPEGVTVRLPAEQTLISVVAPEKEVEEAAPGAPGAAGAAAAAGAAPAAGAAAPAAGAAPAAEAAPAKDEKKKK
jgi:large subunit ribosomal protein L25